MRPGSVTGNCCKSVNNWTCPRFPVVPVSPFREGGGRERRCVSHLEKPGAPATGGGIENHRQNMAECRGQLMAVAFNNAARQPSLAGATGFSGRQRGGASRLSKADAPITSCQAGMDGDSSALHELVPAAFFDPQILLRRPKTFPSSARMTTSTSMASPGFGNT